MARENQGLQMALIGFVVLTILFAVMTFVFFNKAKEANIQLDAVRAELKTAKDALNNSQAECNKLKEMVGFAATEGLAAITAEYQKDMETYGGSFEAENRVYRKVLQYLYDIQMKKNTALTAEQEQVKSLTAQLASLEAVKQPQITKALEEATQAGNDLKSERAVFAKELKDTKDNNEQLLAQLQKSQKEAKDEIDKANAKQKEAEDQIRLVSDQYKYTREKLEKMITPTFEVAHGQVRWVDQRDRTVWINLGRADGLKRLTTFSVYSSDTNDVTKAGRKGSLEVTQVSGEHSAQARIVEDEIADPIMPGDVIHTPVWAPGQREHFALVGFLDIDGDGKSDRELIENLIRSNGAVIDAWIDDKGTPQGKLTTDTHYLVEGAAPDPSATREMTTAYTELKREAERLGIRKISAQDLLRRMGYKDENRVVRFGKHTNSKDFPARFPDDQVPQVSAGEVSGLYMDKLAPKPVRGSAY